VGDNMKVLITGGAGFIGSHTTDLLIDNGYKVTILDNLEPQIHQSQIPNYLNSNVEFLQGDITDINFLEKALKDIDVVIHLAALVGIAQSMYQPSRYLSVNTVGTANLYELLLKRPDIKKNIKKIIILGSKTIYGEGTYECKNCGIIYPPLRSKEQLEKKDWEVHCPNCNEYAKPVGIKEDKPPNILSVYALSKYDTEKLAMNFSFALDIPTFIFRGFSIYGPRQSLNNPYSGVIAIFSNRIKNKKPPIIFEDGRELRDYIYIEDVARLIELSLKNDNYGIYNVGTGVPTSVLEIANQLTNIFDSDVECKITQEFRVGDNRHDFADISKIEKELKFKPKWKLRQGLEKFVEWSDTQKTIDLFEKAEAERKSRLG
jgi:dTDP-L-rhamnose 4-epimerase